jgi:hypothetical protein
MKKLSFLCLLSSLFCLGVAFAYTSADVDNANSLADQGIINYQSAAKNYRLDSTITRAEALKIALSIK